MEPTVNAPSGQPEAPLTRAPETRGHQPESPGGPGSLGPYIDLTPHARGGLGEVFRGADPALHRTVAVKRLQDRLADNPDSRRRFLLEAEITARLEHPGVVPVYGLFEESGKRPGYAMRFVQGPTLWEAIRTYYAGPPDPVAFRRLLQAYLRVCQTIAYAHSRGIIHRDLKPQNVMLGKFGETLVVDWGLAKVVGRPEEVKAVPTAEETLAPARDSGSETAMGSALGTPAYMSPEQAAGRLDVINHASDVYGLGAVLYTLLTGVSPLEASTWPEMQQRIQRGDFARPRQVQPGVPKPLEAICLQAMALEPAHRYPSAQALATDVEHWLAGEPVAAYREPILARSRRWMRQHRTLMTSTVVLLLTALAAAAMGLLLLRQKNQQVLAERNAARQAADEAEAVNAFLTNDLLGQADPSLNSRDKKVTVEEVLAKAATKIDGNPKFAERPLIEATLRLTMGKTYHKLGNLPQAEAHLRRAMELRREHLPPESPKALAAQEVFADFLNLGPGRFAEAEPLARQTWEARARVLGPDDRDTLDSLDTYASALKGLGQIPAATLRQRECLAARRRVLGLDHPDTLTSMNNLAVTLSDQGEWAEAATLYREVLGHRDRDRDPEEYLKPVCNLASSLYYQGELEEAERMLREHVQWSRRRFGAEHPFTDRVQDFLVRVCIERGKVEEGVSLAREVVAFRRRTYPPGSVLIAKALGELGHGLVLLGKYGDAESVLAEAMQLYAKQPKSQQYFIAWAKCWYGASLAGLGRHAPAASALLDAEQQLRETPAAPRRHHRQAVEQLVKLYNAWGKPDEAAAWRKKL
jgi:serine/threonine protein kinase